MLFAVAWNGTANAHSFPPITLTEFHVSAMGGPDKTGYTFMDSDESGGPAFSWEDISEPGNEISTFNDNDDGFSDPVHIGFSFPFYSRTYTETYISTNAYMSFGEGSKKVSSLELPHPNPPNNAIVLFGDDTYIESDTRIYAKSDTLPNRFIVQFDNLHRYPDGSRITAQAILYETGDVVLNYKDAPVQPLVVGLENDNGSDALNYDASNVKSSLAVRFFAPETHCFVNLDGTIYYSIQDAADAASDNDVLMVAGTCSGVRVSNGVTQTLYLDKPLTVSGGYTMTNWLTPNPAKNPTVLDAKGLGRVIHVADTAGSVTIKGLHLTGGDATDLGGGPAGSDAGGGIYAKTATVKLYDNWLEDNIAEYGSGLYLDHVPAEMDGNTIARNVATRNGGGAYIRQGLVEITDTTVTHNQAGHDGGGIYLDTNDPMIRHVAILDNEAGLSGGGIYMDTSNPKVVATTIIGNRAITGGGGMYLDASNPDILNTVIAQNDVNSNGSALYVRQSSPHLRFTTVDGNSGTNGIYITNVGTLTSTVALTNTIISDYFEGLSVNAGNVVRLESTLWYNNTTRSTGAGTIQSNNPLAGDPSYLDSANRNYHITESSAALDAGVDVGIAKDLDEQPRPAFEGFDIGADEFPLAMEASKEVNPTPIYAGNDATFTVVVSNTSVVEVQAIITDTMPLNFTPTGIVTRARILAPGEVWSEDFAVTADEGFENSGVNQARISVSDGFTSIYTDTEAAFTVSMPRVEFEQANFDIDEGGETATITVRRVGSTSGIVTVDYATSDDTAFSDSDYFATSGKLKFLDGEDTQTFTVDIKDDIAHELSPNPESLILTLSNVTGNAKLGNPAQATLRIHDDEPLPAGVIEFPDATFSALESDGAVEVEVVRNVGSTGAVSAKCNVTGLTATEGDDFIVTPLTSNVTFADGQTSTNGCRIEILEDSDIEGSESILLSLSDALGGAELLSQSSAILIIEDNDVTPHGVLQFSDPIFTETEDGVEAEITVERIGGDMGEVAARVTSSNGSAISGSDYTSLNEIVSFGDADSTSKTVRLKITNDAEVEGSETVNLALSDVTGGALRGSQDTTVLTIQDDDKQSGGVLEFSDLSYMIDEDEAGGTLYVQVNRVGGSYGDVSATVSTSDGTATSPPDYASGVFNVSFADGQTTPETISITIYDDSEIEGAETFELTLSNATGQAKIGSQDTATAIIDDNETVAPGVLQFGSPSMNIVEDNVQVTIPVMRIGGTYGSVTARVTSTDGTTTVGNDYINVDTMVTFGDGDGSADVTVDILEDTDEEGSEYLNLTITDETGGAAIGSQDKLVLVIDDDDDRPNGVLEFSSEDYSVSESLNEKLITVRRIGGDEGIVRVRATTSDGSATAGSDYSSVDTILTFGEGVVERTFSVPLNGDDEVEGSETINLTLSDAQGGADIGSQSNAVLVIQDDDTTGAGVVEFEKPIITISEQATSATIDVRRIGGAAGIVRIDVASSDDSATAGDDYGVVTTTLTFGNGDVQESVTVPIFQDSAVEGSEVLTLHLSNPQGGVDVGSQDTVTLVIEDADTLPAGIFQFEQTSYTLSEGIVQTDITIERVGGSAGAVSVDVTSSDGTATAGDDYGAVNKTIHFADGAVSQSFTVQIKDDDEVEGSELFELTLSNPTGGAQLPTHSTVPVLIDDNDTVSAGTLELIQPSFTGTEGTTVQVKIRRVGGDKGSVTVDLSTSDDTATEGSDYAGTTETVQFMENETSKTVGISLLEDDLVEGSETITLTLTNASGGATLGAQRTAVLVVHDNDTESPGLLEFNTPIFVVNENDSTASITVARVGGAVGTVTVRARTSNGTAIAGSDYSAVDTTVTFNANETTRTFDIPIIIDAELEASETLSLTLSLPTGGADLGSQTTAVLVIEDDDTRPAGVFVFNPATMTASEGDSTATIVVERVGGNSAPATVELASVDGTAISGSDYTALSQVLHFDAGETSKLVPLTIIEDTNPEGSETLDLVLSNATGGALIGTPNTAVLVINDNDNLAPGVLQFSQPQYPVDEDSSPATITIERIGGDTGTVTVDIDTGDNTAIAGSDYGSVSETITFLDSDKSKTVDVSLVNDSAVEGSEIVDLTISNPTGGAVLATRTTAELIIHDNDTVSPGTIEFSQPSFGVNEGDTATITIRRIGGDSGPVQVQFSTSDGTATGSDYDPVLTPVLLNTGETTRTVSVPTAEDTLIEGSETINLQLSGVSGGASLGSQNSAVLVVRDNDTVSPGTVEFDRPAIIVGETDGTATITIHRVGGASGTVTVNATTSDGTASAGDDYGSLNDTITFLDGQDTQSFDVSITEDHDIEGSETFTVTLGSVTGGGELGTQHSIAVVINDDDTTDPGTVILQASSFTVDEDESEALVALERVGGDSGTITVDLTTSDGTATAGDDYSAGVQTVTFNEGEIVKTAPISILQDDNVEGSEVVNLALSNPTGDAHIGMPNTAVLIINDDDATESAGVIQFISSSFSSGEETGSATITVERIGGSDGVVTVDIATSDNAATAGDDYTATSTTLTFNETETIQSVDVPLINDDQVEGTETVSITLSNVSGGAVPGSQSTALLLINDDDTVAAGTVEFDAPLFTITEATVNAQVNVCRVGGAAGDITIDIASSDDSATAGSDYTSVNRTLSLSDSQLCTVVDIPILDDDEQEGSETMTLTLSNPTGDAVLGTQKSTVLVINDNETESAGIIEFSTPAESIVETNGDVPITVCRTGGTSGSVAVDVETSDDTATAGSDYTSVVKTINFASTEACKTFNVPVLDDDEDESSETITLKLSNPTNGATLGTQTTMVVVIEDNETTSHGMLEFSQPSFFETEGSTTAAITITRVGGDRGPVGVDVTASDGTATDGLDYAAGTVHVQFVDGESSKQVLLTLIEDSLVEGSETVNLALSNPTGGARLGSQNPSVLVIEDNDTTAQGVLEFSSPTFDAEEGDGTATIAIQRVGGDSGTVEVDIATSDGTATAGSDYGSVVKTVTFLDSDTIKMVDIPLVEESAVEGSETVNLTLSNPTGEARLGAQRKALLVIDDNDTIPAGVIQFSATAFSTSEESGTVAIPIERIGDTSGMVSVQVTTSDDTATASADYTAVNQVVTFLDGEDIRFVDVEILSDGETEGSETVNLTLSNVSGGAQIGSQDSAVLLIHDDDTVPAGTLQFTQASYTVKEADGVATVTVERVGGANGAVSVRARTSDDSSTEGSDYTGVDVVLTFEDGVTTQPFDVSILEDQDMEGSEVVKLLLSDPTGDAELGTQRETVLVINDDDTVMPGTIQLDGATFSANENDGTATITLERIGGTNGEVDVRLTTTDQSATAGSDYTAVDTIVTFADGEPSRTVDVDITNDDESEGAEVVNITLSAPTNNATLGTQSTGLLVIQDDDTVPPGIIQLMPIYTVTENGTQATIAVQRIGGHNGTVSVDITTYDNTATAGADYDSVHTMLTFNNGDTSKSIQVPIHEDDEVEGTEIVRVELSGVTGGAILGTQNSAVLAINDNDTDDAGVVQFSDPSFVGTEGGGNAVITVERIGGSSGTVTVQATTSIGTAIAGADYDSVNTVLTFNPGDTNVTFEVPIHEDDLVEGDEIVNLALTNVTGGAQPGSQREAVLVVQDNDRVVPGVLQFSRPLFSAYENTLHATITVERLGASDGTVTVRVTTSNGTAFAGEDYTAVDKVLTFNDGETSKTFDLTLIDDEEVEGSEVFNLNLRDITGGAIMGTQNSAVVVIQDDDVISPGVVQFDTSSFSISEGAGNATITVKRVGGDHGTVTVQAMTTYNTAMPGDDYDSVSTSLTFNDGETTAIFQVPVHEDSIVEGSEVVNLALSNVTGGAELGTQNEAVLIIEDNDTISPGVVQFEVPMIAINEAAGTALITVQRVGGTGGTINVKAITTYNSALPNIDYTSVDTMLTFNNGETTKTFEVPIINDKEVEGTEFINLVLSNPTGGAELGTQKEATLVIQDNDTSAPGVLQFGVPFISVSENVGEWTIPVQRIGGAGGTVKVDVMTMDETTQAGDDYTPLNTTLTFEDGQTLQTFTISVTDDDEVEGSETLKLQLIYATGGAHLGSQKSTTLVIQDNDTNAPGVIQFNHASYTTSEGAGDASITLQRIGGSDGEVTVEFSTEDEQATAGSDYTSVNETVTFSDGETIKHVTIPIIEDSDIEGSELVKLHLQGVTGGALLGSQHMAMLVIEDNEPVAPGVFQFSQDEYEVAENGGDATITVERTSGSIGTVTVDYVVVAKSATKGIDFIETSGRLTFRDGEAVQTFSIPVLNDNQVEADETVELRLVNAESTPAGAQIGSVGTAILTIKNDDTNPVGKLHFNSSSATVNEDDGSIEVIVMRTDGTNGTVSVDYNVVGGNAREGKDFVVAGNGEIIFPDGESKQRITIAIQNDEQVEKDEKFTLKLSNPSNGATLASPSTMTITIEDDDVPPAGMLQFSKPTYRVEEDAGTITIDVDRVGGDYGDLEVEYTIGHPDDSADGGEGEEAGEGEEPGDYTTTSGILTFPDGETSASFDITINDDEIPEGYETLTMRLFNPSNGELGTQSEAVLVIEDNDPFPPGMLQFSNPEFTVKEDAITATLRVVRTNGSEGTVTVKYRTEDGTARAGEDYDATGGTLTFDEDDEDPFKIFSIRIHNNNEVEEDKTINLILESPTGGAGLGTQNTAVLTILEDDNELSGGLPINFAEPVYEAKEDDGKVRITFRRNQDIERSVPISGVCYRTRDDTARAGQDYESARGEIKLDAGKPSGAFTINILDRKDISGDREFIVKLYSCPESVGTLQRNTSPNHPASFQPAHTAALQSALFYPGQASNMWLAYNSRQDVMYDFIPASSGGVSRLQWDIPEELYDTKPDTKEEDQARVTIQETDAPVQGVLQFTEANPEVGESDKQKTITVFRSGGVSGKVTVDYLVTGVSATEYSDFVPASGTLTFESGEDEKTFKVAISSDTEVEGEEFISLALDNVTGGAVLAGQTTAELKIIDDDYTEYGVVQFEEASYETHEDGGIITLIVERAMAIDTDAQLTVDFNVDDTNSSASNSQDYVLPQDGTITFGPGELTKQIQVEVNEDDEKEGNETLKLVLSNVTGGAKLGSQDFTELTIRDNDLDEDDTLLQFSSSSYTVAEGDEEGEATIRVQRLGNLQGQSKVMFKTQSGNNTQEGEDYDAVEQQLHFEPNESFQTVSIPIYGNEEIDGTRSVDLVLEQPSGGTLGTQSTATLVIEDDDGGGSSSRVVEYRKPRTTIQFGARTFSASEQEKKATISLFRSGPDIDKEATVYYDMFDQGNAKEGVDYHRPDQPWRTVVFDPNETVKEVEIDIEDDEFIEGTEIVRLQISNVTGESTEQGSVNRAVLRIVDDDHNPNGNGVIEFGAHEFSAGEDTGEEDIEVEIDVVRIGGASGEVTVGYEVYAGSADEDDFDTISDTLTFAPDETRKSFKVHLHRDTEAEGTEIVQLKLSNPGGGAKLGDLDSAHLKIIDNDTTEGGIIRFSDTKYQVHEDAPGTIDIEVVREGGSSGSVSIDYRLFDGTASFGEDYVHETDVVSRSGKLTFAAGVSESLRFTINIKDDEQTEGSETVLLVLSNPTNGAVLGTHNMTVLEIVDDEPPIIHFNKSEYIAYEDDGEIAIPVLIEPIPDPGETSQHTQTVTVEYQVVSIEAESGKDFVANSIGTLELSPDEYYQYIPIEIISDTLDEDIETLKVELVEITDKPDWSEVKLSEPDTAIVKIHSGNRPDPSSMVVLLKPDREFVQPHIQDDVSLTIDVLGHDCDPIPGITVAVSTDLGELDKQQVTTDKDGTAMVRLVIPAEEVEGKTSAKATVVAVVDGETIGTLQVNSQALPGASEEITVDTTTTPGGNGFDVSASDNTVYLPIIMSNIGPAMQLMDNSESVMFLQNNHDISVTDDGDFYCKGPYEPVTSSAPAATIELSHHYEQAQEKMKARLGETVDITVSATPANGGRQEDTFDLLLEATTDLGTISPEKGKTDNNGKTRFTWSVPEDLRVGTATVTVKAEDGSVGTTKITTEPLPCNDVDDNDVMRNAKELDTINEACRGSLKDDPVGREGDDYYKIDLDGTYNLTIFLRDIPPGADYDLQLGLFEQENKDALKKSKTPGNNDEKLQFIDLSEGEYYLRVFQRKKAPDHTYTLAFLKTPK